MSKKLYLKSLGCNKNLVDSEIMLGRLSEYELCDEAKQADVLIVNTCGFINSAKEESISSILELHSLRKQNSLLVVSGCLMQRYKDELMKELPEVDIFTGVADYEKIDEMILKKSSLFSSSTYLQGENSKRVITGSNFHAFVKISEGCNQSCAFCAIPSFKGKLKSRSLQSISTEVQNLVKQGFKDFSFIAQDSSSYMLDMGVKDGLCLLIDEIEKIEGVKSARILYLYPSSLSTRLIEKIISSRVFVNYFDMPLQHISDKMLKIMRRNTPKKSLLEKLTLMKNAKNCFLRTAFIVGHPEESDEDFDELCDFIKSFEFDRISIFAYSKEEDTAAFSMKQVPFKLINKRMKIIEKLVDESINKSFEKELGKVVQAYCLGGSSEGEFFYGAKDIRWDRDIDGEILINESLCGALKMGDLYELQITQVLDKKLLAKAIRKL